MPVADPSIAWWAFLIALGGIAAASFLVSWVLTDVLRVPRAVYLASLMVVTAALTWGYLAWSGSEISWTRHLVPGVLGALASGAIMVAALLLKARRAGLPRPTGRRPAAVVGAMAWEAVLYGAAEGILLSGLPVLAAWQSFRSLGWTDASGGAVAAGVLAVVASAAVIWVHHLGYREFRRTRQVLLPIAACGILSVAYLVSRSAIAPIGGHILTHAGLDLRGIAMPPYSGELWSVPPPSERLRLVA